MTDPAPVCAVCARPLSLFGGLDGGPPFWEHTGEDHDAIPVPADHLPHHRPVCDFCTAADTPLWDYPAESFAESVGGWAACPTCHDLIEEGDRDELIRRSAEMFVARRPAMAPAIASIRALIADWHNGFFAHRTGPANPP